MKIETSFEEFEKLAELNQSVAISALIQADRFTPISIFEKIYNHFGNGLFMELSHDYPSKILMGFEPRGFFQVKHGVFEAKIDGKEYSFKEDFLHSLRLFKKLVKVESNLSVSNLTGGMVGLVSYEAIKLFEEKLNQLKISSDIPQFLFYCYKINLVFCPKNQEIILSIVVHAENNLKKHYKKAIRDLENLKNILEEPLNGAFFEEYENRNFDVKTNISDDSYQLLVEKAKKYIKQGEIFQVVLSRTFKRTYQVPPFHIYCNLRKITPAPYLFYLDDGKNIILGASPEKLVSVKNNRVETVPIAGTCKNTDQETINALLKDEKELAEHMMLVDLSRNDIGKVCVAGSVQVESLLTPKKAGNLVHLTTLVTGELSDSCDAFDALKAVFPAGTVSGAPKIRAMEIINELEPISRGFYAGAFCFLDNFGDFDSAILIRTMILKDGVVTVRAGGGIVFDSIPIKEAQESEAKALSVLRAIPIPVKEENNDVINY